ncbi:exodeoxyribonuclease VII large subunit [Bacillus massiliigorillae]|uniref:exodeoxyribonuclease VII large subunit n=1 Tax=Bacillus massiliigorillae TaxID=1243664 RepID=UPI00039B7170|nr:exodeoxyribonuclease VII large subunit [Bacillus massiliigorillae]
MTIEQYVTVTALTKYIKRKFDYDPHLRDIYIKGEISNYKRHSSGHMYFTLKDEKARISAVMFSSNNSSLMFEPENGMKVLIRGEVSVFEQSGNYQVYVREMHPDGIGDLFIAFQQLKEKLEGEGLFASEHKQHLPKYPSTIGVITSPTGAAVRDIMTTLKRRYPMGNVMMFPALVQGPQAPDSIIKAIKRANDREDIDVLIVGRGGGSIEELWAFNDEKVARAIYASHIPIISAVGHETDTTIADFVGDVRAATPTAAAELAVPHYVELKKTLAAYVSKMTTFVSNEIKQKEAALTRLDKSYAFRYPEKLYQQKVEQLDLVMERLQKESRRYFDQKLDKVQYLHQVLRRFHPNDKIKMHMENIVKHEKQLKRLMKTNIQTKEQKFVSTMSKLNVLNPLNIMERGYSIAFDKQQNVIKSNQQVDIGDSISVVVKDGQLLCEVKDRKESVLND